MNLDVINNRVDAALNANKRAELLVVGMAISIFLLGAGMLAVAYSLTNPYFGTGTFILQSFLYWPIHKVLRIRKDNLVLQTLPVLVAELPPHDAIEQIKKLAEHLRGQ